MYFVLANSYNIYVRSQYECIYISVQAGLGRGVEIKCVVTKVVLKLVKWSKSVESDTGTFKHTRPLSWLLHRRELLTGHPSPRSYMTYVSLISLNSKLFSTLVIDSKVSIHQLTPTCLGNKSPHPLGKVHTFSTCICYIYKLLQLLINLLSIQTTDVYIVNSNLPSIFLKKNKHLGFYGFVVHFLQMILCLQYP